MFSLKGPLENYQCLDYESRALSTTPKLARAPRGTERRREQRALNFSAPTWFYWAAINRVLRGGRNSACLCPIENTNVKTFPCGRRSGKVGPFRCLHDAPTVDRLASEKKWVGLVEEAGGCLWGRRWTLHSLLETGCRSSVGTFCGHLRGVHVGKRAQNDLYVISTAPRKLNLSVRATWQ